MKVKLFTANTIQEAMAQVKNTLGRDAVILQTRRFRKGGFAGFFGKEMIEIMAAADAPAARPIEKAPQFTPLKPSELPIAATSKMDNGDHSVTHLKNEIISMRRMLEKLLNKSDIGINTTPWHELLLNNEIDNDLIGDIFQGIPLDNNVIGNNPEIVKQLITDKLLYYCKKIEGINIPAVGCKKVAFIGSTGVGKTTTIAKLAAHFVLNEGMKVAFIASDTYRIAAVEQLKIYANILNIPIEVVYLPNDLQNALSKHQDKNLVLIDTAGRNPSNETHMDELRQLLAVDPSIETYLVLSSTMKYQYALEIVDKFHVCNPEKFIFTKLDESRNIGLIFNLLYRYPQIALSYITTGQNVPDDIEIANSQNLVNQLLKEK